jgi:hypothetical protein
MLIKNITSACLTSALLLVCASSHGLEKPSSFITDTSFRNDNKSFTEAEVKAHALDILKNEETCEEVHLSSRQEATSSVDICEDRIASFFVEEYVNLLIAGSSEEEAVLLLNKALEDHSLGDYHINSYVNILKDKEFMDEVRDLVIKIRTNINNKSESFRDSLKTFLEKNKETIKQASLEHSEDKRRLLFQDIEIPGDFEFSFTGLRIILPKFNIQQYADSASAEEKSRGLCDILRKSNCSIFIKYFAKEIAEAIIDLL